MQRIALDAYVLDVLMPDLVGHDRRPATFIVYLFLLGKVARGRSDAVSVSLQTIANPLRVVLRPWAPRRP